MPRYNGLWIRTEYYRVWGVVDARDLDEANELAAKGQYEEMFRKYDGCIDEHLEGELDEEDSMAYTQQDVVRE